MGTPEFAVPSLDMLVKENYEVVAVVTQPDKPKGRGKKVTPPPVAEYATARGIRLLQPEKVKCGDFIAQLKELNPDLIVTAAYGKILPREVLELPRFGCINVHASLLPHYRGAAPIQWAIINGETKTGITTMLMDEGLDTGDILLQKEVEITEDMTAGELHDILAVLGAAVLRETLARLNAGTLTRTRQDDDKASYAKMLDKNIGCIDWSRSAREIHNLVRGTNPWPGAYTFYNGEKMKVWRTSVKDDTAGKAPGTILSVNRDGISVACGLGTVVIRELQFSNCRRMAVCEYICGHEIVPGQILSSC